MRRNGQKGKMKTKKKWANSKEPKSFPKEAVSEVESPRGHQAEVRAASGGH